MSLIPLMKNPQTPWKKAVFSQFPRAGNYMGYSVRTAQYRYTEWVKFIGEPYYQPLWDKNVGTELYDHKTDPEENFNRAKDNNYTDIKTELNKLLRLGWRHVLPKQATVKSDRGMAERKKKAIIDHHHNHHYNHHVLHQQGKEKGNKYKTTREKKATVYYHSKHLKNKKTQKKE